MKKKQFLSVVIPGYNESAIIEQSLGRFYEYMNTLDDQYDWEIVFVNDGSKDDTGSLADNLKNKYPRLKVLHHLVNKGLGQALKTGFDHSKGDFLVVMDLDLSYSPDHIPRLLDKMKMEEADIVVASPYAKGGKLTNVPMLRSIMSRVVNYLMSLVAQTKLHTFTGMVRAYRREFIRYLDLKATSQVINPEIIYKGIILRASIAELPAHLDWTFQKQYPGTRVSSMKIIRGVLKGLMSAFVFRPYAFFLTVGIILLFISLYIIVWIFINMLMIYPDVIAQSNYFDAQFSMAIAETFKARPHAFFVGGITLIVGLQFMSTGFLSLQNKRNFEELYHINSTLLKTIKKKKKSIRNDPAVPNGLKQL
jgi:glycosyltransferase involved in cell wall biosynthesis